MVVTIEDLFERFNTLSPQEVGKEWARQHREGSSVSCLMIYHLYASQQPKERGSDIRKHYQYALEDD